MWKKPALVLAITALAAGCAQQPDAPTATAAIPDPAAEAAAQAAAQVEANKKVAMEFFREGITADERYELMHPDYIQHNPIFKKFGELNGTKGREEFKLLLSMPGRTPPPGTTPDPKRPPNDPYYQVMADGDLVTILQKRYQPDPLKPGEYYEVFWFDTWRIKEGKLYEHWDAATIDPNNIPPFLKTRVDQMR